MKSVFTAVGSRIKAVALAAVHGNRERPWEDGVLQNARNISRLIDEIGRERTKLASINDVQGLVEVDRVLSHLQHNITRQVREVLEDPKNPRFADALHYVLLADQQMARIKDLDGFSREVQAKIGPVEWLAMRAAVYTELTDGMKRDAMRYIPHIDIDQVAPVRPSVATAKPRPVEKVVEDSPPAVIEQPVHYMDVEAAPEPTPEDLVEWHDGPAPPVNIDQVTQRSAYEHYLY